MCVLVCVRVSAYVCVCAPVRVVVGVFSVDRIANGEPPPPLRDAQAGREEVWEGRRPLTSTHLATQMARRGQGELLSPPALSQTSAAMREGGAKRKGGSG